MMFGSPISTPVLEFAYTYIPDLVPWPLYHPVPLAVNRSLFSVFAGCVSGALLLRMVSSGCVPKATEADGCLMFYSQQYGKPDNRAPELPAKRVDGRVDNDCQVGSDAVVPEPLTDG
ncbi:hypothetical protein M404DRAFT_536235 [Pisolithus tinctorius Marx 270]|uniref:Uncharacterized protein n=1 Tax=Pisolithus tinctorius Marx 270 TaxID=870435 RepID=A0A0C3NCE2_PISTI|nr:hypothetical protein M404DRAFT_536235 [Pisolithus tinctorius Marx 270]